MPTSAVTVVAKELAGQYREFLMALLGHLSLALNAGDPTSSKSRADLTRKLRTAAETFLNGAGIQIKQQTETIKEASLGALDDALVDPDLSSLSEYLEGMMDDLYASLSEVVRSDTAQVERELRKFALNVDLLRSRTGISKIGAIIKLRMPGASAQLKQVDSIGRRRMSGDYVETMYRQFLVFVSIESQLFAIAKSGSDLARVFRDDQDAGTAFSITGATGGFPTYAEIRDKFFHPNSTAHVEATGA